MHSCQQVKLGTLCRLPGLTGRKVGTTSSHHGPYTQGYTRTTGLHTYYNGTHKGQRYREVEPIPKNVSQSGLQSATRLHEVGIASNSRSAYSGECVPGPCTHRPSHHESRFYPKPVSQLAIEAAVYGRADDWGEVVTR